MSTVEYVGDDLVIEISGGNLGAPVEIQATSKKVEIGGNVDAIETTRGAKQKYKQFAPGMIECPIKMKLGITLATAGTVAAGDTMPDYLRLDTIYTLKIMPDGSTTGLPLHEGEYFLEGNPLVREAGRNERVHDTSWKQHKIITNIHEGGVVA